MADFTDIKKGDKVVIEIENIFVKHHTITATVTKVTKYWIIANTEKYSRTNGERYPHSPFATNKIIRKL